MENEFDGKLLLSAEEAAKALGICTKSLWNFTTPRGTIPAVKIGSRVLYSPADLRTWIEKKGGAERFELASVHPFENGATHTRAYIHLLDRNDVIEIGVTAKDLESFSNFQTAVKAETGLTLAEPAGEWEKLVAAKGGQN